jgi:O-antigen ligase
VNNDIDTTPLPPFVSLTYAEPDAPRYKATFVFISLYYLISHGRIHLLLPALQLVPSAMIMGILAVISFFLERNQKKDDWHFIREEKLLVALMALSVALLPFSVWVGNSFNSLFKGYMPTVILALIAGFICKTSKDVEKFLWIYALNCTFVVFMSLSAGIGHFSTGVTDMYDVNDIAMVLVCSLPILFYLMLQQRGVRKILLGLFLILAVLTIIKAGSRGGILGLLVIPCYIVLNSRSKIKALVISALILMVLFAVAPEEAKERVISMAKPETEYDQNFGNRKQIWQRGLSLVAGSPLVGAGLGNYSVADGNLTGIGAWKTAHNSYLQITVELGLFGFGLYVMLTVGTFLKLRFLRMKLAGTEARSSAAWIVNGAELSILTFMVTSFFLSQAYNPQFYFLIAMVIAAKKIVIKESEVAKTSEVLVWS